MERFNRKDLSAYVEYVYRHDIQILVNRRQARALYNTALLNTAEGELFEFPLEKAEKIATFLELSDPQGGPGGSVNVYAFVRLMGDLRRELARPRDGPAPSPSGGSGASVDPSVSGD